ncbi:acyltransferase [Bacteroidota bacterium]
MENTKEEEPIKKQKEDVDAATTDRSGFAGFIEWFLRRFRLVAFFIGMVPMYLMCLLAMSIAATPGIMLFHFLLELLEDPPILLYYGVFASGLVLGFFIYGITMLFVAPLFNLILPLKLKPFRGGYYSLPTIPWYFHNALIYVVRYTFLEFVTPTPLNIMFYKFMGMKIGKGCHINTTNISDACLIELEDKVTIGGSAHIIAHYASHGYLIVDRVKIKKGASVGLKASIMGDVEIGEGAIIGPHEVILPKSRIAPGRKAFDREDEG